jgi:DNA-binding NtrC family response regulator
MPKTILVVENEVRGREIITQFLREANYEVQEADDGVSAIALLDNRPFDLVICDLVMPRIGALEVISYLNSRALSTAVILITGHPELVNNKGLGHLPVFSKPFNMYDLLHKVEEMLGK